MPQCSNKLAVSMVTFKTSWEHPGLFHSDIFMKKLLPRS